MVPFAFWEEGKKPTVSLIITMVRSLLEDVAVVCLHWYQYLHVGHAGQ